MGFYLIRVFLNEKYLRKLLIKRFAGDAVLYLFLLSVLVTDLNGSKISTKPLKFCTSADVISHSFLIFENDGINRTSMIYTFNHIACRVPSRHIILC